MATKKLLTIEQYAALDEPVGVRHELSEGALIVTPSANFLHNTTRDRINARLQAFLNVNPVGEVVSEMDVTVGADTVGLMSPSFAKNVRRALISSAFLCRLLPIWSSKLFPRTSARMT